MNVLILYIVRSQVKVNDIAQHLSPVNTWIRYNDSQHERNIKTSHKKKQYKQQCPRNVQRKLCIKL